MLQHLNCCQSEGEGRGGVDRIRWVLNGNTSCLLLLSCYPITLLANEKNLSLFGDQRSPPGPSHPGLKLETDKLTADFDVILFFESNKKVFREVGTRK